MLRDGWIDCFAPMSDGQRRCRRSQERTSRGRALLAEMGGNRTFSASAAQPAVTKSEPAVRQRGYRFARTPVPSHAPARDAGSGDEAFLVREAAADAGQGFTAPCIRRAASNRCRNCGSISAESCSMAPSVPCEAAS